MITKQAIASAICDLMRRKSLDKITVKDIVAECHITRQTFYYHFRDIPDLFEWCAKQEMEKLLRRSLANENIEEVLMEYAEELLDRDYRQLMMKIYRSRYRDSFREVMLREIKYYFLGICRQRKALDHLSVKDLGFLMDFYAAAFAGLREQWVFDESADVKEGIRMTARVMRGELHL